MTARANRVVLVVVGVILFAIGGFAAAVGGGAFGRAPAHHAVVDSTVIHWWNEGGWESFAAVTAIGVVLLLAGAWLIHGQLRTPNTSRVPTIVFPLDTKQGETRLRPRALRQAVESDLGTLPGIVDVSVQLIGSYPSVELRARLTVTDDSQLDTLQDQLAGPLARAEATTGIRLSPVTVMIRFAAQDQRRQLA